MNKNLKRIATIAGILALAILVVSAAQKKRSRDASDLIVRIENLPDGNSLVSKEDIILTIERSFGHTLSGIPIGALDVERVERVLENEAFIADADVYVDAEQKVHIGISQRRPVVRIIDRNGLNYYLDAEGNKMPLSKHFAARVLVATGNIPPHVPDFQKRKEHVIKDLFSLTKTILDDEFLDPLVEQIYVNKSEEFVLVPNVGKQKIVLGSLEDLNDKIARLKTFYKEGMPYAGWKRYKTINLKFKGQVVCKKG